VGLCPTEVWAGAEGLAWHEEELRPGVDVVGSSPTGVWAGAEAVGPTEVWAGTEAGSGAS